MADLTSFNFHALRFLQSENTRQMTAKEVGQYLLLLIEAWLGGKSASLPTELDKLNTMVRIPTGLPGRPEKISDKVLAMFPLVETEFGPRRRNETLYGEWVIANNRSNLNREAAGARWIGNASAMQTHSDGIMHEKTPPLYSINKSKERKEYVLDSSNFGQGSFKNISIKYFQAFGVHHSSNAKAVEKYQRACEQFGEDFVLEAFDRWAKQNQWVKEHDGKKFGLTSFYPVLEIEVLAKQTGQTEEQSSVQEIEAATSMVEAQLEKEKLDAEKVAKYKKEEQEIAEKTKGWVG